MIAATAALDVALRDLDDPHARNQVRLEQLERSLEDARRAEELDRESYRQTGAALRAAIFGTREAVADTEAELAEIAADPDFEILASADDIRLAEGAEAAMREARDAHEAEVRDRPELRSPTDAVGPAYPPLPEDERVFH